MSIFYLVLFSLKITTSNEAKDTAIVHLIVFHDENIISWSKETVYNELKNLFGTVDRLISRMLILSADTVDFQALNNILDYDQIYAIYIYESIQFFSNFLAQLIILLKNEIYKTNEENGILIKFCPEYFKHCIDKIEIKYKVLKNTRLEYLKHIARKIFDNLFQNLNQSPIKSIYDVDYQYIEKIAVDNFFIGLDSFVDFDTKNTLCRILCDIKLVANQIRTLKLFSKNNDYNPKIVTKYIYKEDYICAEKPNITINILKCFRPSTNRFITDLNLFLKDYKRKKDNPLLHFLFKEFDKGLKIKFDRYQKLKILNLLYFYVKKGIKIHVRLNFDKYTQKVYDLFTSSDYFKEKLQKDDPELTDLCESIQNLRDIFFTPKEDIMTIKIITESYLNKLIQEIDKIEVLNEPSTSTKLLIDNHINTGINENVESSNHLASFSAIREKNNNQKSLIKEKNQIILMKLICIGIKNSYMLFTCQKIL